MGSHRWHVGRTGFEYAGRRISSAADPCRQTLFPRQVRDRREDWLESGLVRLHLAASADLQKIRYRLFRDAETDVGARVHNVSSQTFLVGSAGRQPYPDLFPA